MKPLHRPYILTSLLFVAAGSLLGLLMVPFLTGWRAAPVWWLGDGADWVVRLRAHGPFQVLGFCVLFTMGIAYQMLGELLNARQSPARLAACLWLMLIGILGQAFTSLPWFLWLQLGSALLFVSSVAGHRPAASVPRRAQPHSHYLRWGSLWLLIALGLNVAGASASRVWELILWGFLSLYILGVGLRIHPSILDRPTPSPNIQWKVLFLWNLGLLLSIAAPLSAATCWLVAALLFCICLRPWRIEPGPHAWPLRAYLGWSYLWLLVACLGRLAVAWPGGPSQWAGAVKHAHASGFVLTMIVGMGLRLVPAFERKPLAWPPARWLCLPLLSVGGMLRLAGQAGWWPGVLLPGAALQAAAVLLFVGVLLVTMLVRRGAESLST